jgi:predicted PurR-regulated permease PerM
MNQVISWLQNMRLRQIVTVFLATVAFLVIPALGYSQSLQAQAKPLTVDTNSYQVDSATVKRIQQKAEDLGDSPERPIGDTGLKNIRKLGENIPETINFNARQKQDADGVVGNVKDQVEGAAKSTKRAVKNAAS